MAKNDDFGGSNNSRVAIGVTAGATYFIKAAAYGATTGAYVVQFSTVASTAPPPTPTPGGFQITLSLSGLTASQQTLASQAAGRWQRVIVGDLPNVQVSGPDGRRRLGDHRWRVNRRPGRHPRPGRP